MRIGTLTLAGALALFAAGVAGTGAASAGHPQADSEAGSLIAARQSGMLMSAALSGQIKAGIDRGDDVKTMGFAARSLNAWAKALPELFPAGSDKGETEAMPAVWSDRAGFDAKAAAYVAATAKLADAAKAGDKAAFAAAAGEVKTACGECHKTYKKPDRH